MSIHNPIPGTLWHSRYVCGEVWLGTARAPIGHVKNRGTGTHETLYAMRRARHWFAVDDARFPPFPCFRSRAMPLWRGPRRRDGSFRPVMLTPRRLENLRLPIRQACFWL